MTCEHRKEQFRARPFSCLPFRPLLLFIKYLSICVPSSGPVRSIHHTTLSCSSRQTLFAPYCASAPKAVVGRLSESCSLQCCLVPGVGARMCVRTFSRLLPFKSEAKSSDGVRWRKCISLALFRASIVCRGLAEFLCIFLFVCRGARAIIDRKMKYTKKSNFSRSRHGKFFRFVFILHFFMVMLTRERRRRSRLSCLGCLQFYFFFLLVA